MILNEIIHEKIRDAYERMKREGRLPSEAQLKIRDDLGYLRFHLIKILQNPPQENRKDAYIHRFEAIAQELGITLHELMTALDEMNGRPYRYWRMGTTRGADGESVWDFMRDGNYVAIGWSDIGDLTDITHGEAGKDEIRERLDDVGYDSTDRDVYPAFKIATEIREGDLVLASRSLTVLGLGRIVGGYYYKNNDASPWPHRLPVECIGHRLSPPLLCKALSSYMRIYRFTHTKF